MCLSNVAPSTKVQYPMNIAESIIRLYPFVPFNYTTALLENIPECHQFFDIWSSTRVDTTHATMPASLRSFSPDPPLPPGISLPDVSSLLARTATGSSRADS